MTTETPTIIQSRAKAAVLKLLREGQITPSEAAWAIGTSRQTVHNWMKLEGIDYTKPRWEHVRRVVALECANAITA